MVTLDEEKRGDFYCNGKVKETNLLWKKRAKLGGCLGWSQKQDEKGPFISRQHLMTWDGNVHQEPNEPLFSHVFFFFLLINCLE